MIARHFPHNTFADVGATCIWHIEALRAEPEVKPPRTTQFSEPAKHQFDSGTYTHVRILLDTAVTGPIGNISPEIRRLLDVTKGSLFRGIEQARVGNRLSDISFAVQSFVEMHGFSVVRDFVGHGIGRALHEEPEIPNYGRAGQGPVLAEGMVFAIEPMVNMGGHRTRILNDGWTVVTEDGKPSAHFEHTIVITSKGPEILTQ